MRSLRYLAMAVLVACTLTAAGAARDTSTGTPRDTPREITRPQPRLQKVIRVLKLIVQPLGDGIVPPHP